MTNVPKMKFPKKHAEMIKEYKNKAPEEKTKTEDGFTKGIKGKGSESYSPTIANINGYELRAMLRVMPSLINTGDDNGD